MRLTRAARRAEESGDAIAHADPKERIPLSDATANALREAANADDVPELEPESKPMPPKRTKSKAGAKKGTRGRKAKAAEEEHVNIVVLEDERQAAGSPASDAAGDELLSGPMPGAEMGQIPMSDERPASPPSRAVRLTRRQLAKHEEVLSPQTVPLEEQLVEGEKKEDTSIQEQKLETTGEPQVTEETGAPVPNDSDENICAPEPEATSEPAEEPESETTCGAEQPTPSQIATPSRRLSKSPGKSPVRLEESFVAIDALEEALENVIPSFNPTKDDQSPKKPRVSTVTRPKENDASAKTDPAPSKSSRNASLARSSKAPSTRPSIARASSVRAAPVDKVRKGSGEVKDYLASKRRPISISFPTPPPPPKASRPPTVANFQLPGEAVAAKLKAQKEERLKREQEGGQRPPSTTLTRSSTVRSSKPPTKSNFQLPGEAVAAKLKAQKEERLKREAEGTADRRTSVTVQPRPLKSTKPPTVPNFSLPGDSVAAKLKAQREERQKREEEEAAKKPVFKARPAPSHKAGPAVVRQTAASKMRESLMAGGPKIEHGTITAKRMSVAPAAKLTSAPKTVKPTVTVMPVDAATLKQKGREVFNRDKLEKERMDKERREKEEAAKKARAEAAERGRIASREWAERQRKKMAAGAAASAKVNGA